MSFHRILCVLVIFCFSFNQINFSISAAIFFGSSMKKKRSTERLDAPSISKCFCKCQCKCQCKYNLNVNVNVSHPTHPYLGKIKKNVFFFIFFNSLYTVMTMQSLTKPASPQVGPFVYQALTIKDTVEEDGKSNLRYNEDRTTLTYRPRSPIE